jgi:lipopolysaccharide transport protein LptA
VVKRIFLTIYLTISLLLQSLSLAISAPKNPPIIITKITSDFINIKRQNETAHFVGNVVVEREDFSMKSDNALVYYVENKGEGDNVQNSAIQKIEAENNVKIFNEEFVATGNYAIYNPSQNNVILKENVIFNNGTSIAKGEKFIYDLKTQKGNLLGQIQENKKTDKNSDQRVIVIINENDDLKNKNE